MSNPSQETLPQMPPHLAERLQHDQEQFEKHLTQDQLTESITSASERHEQVLQAKQMDAHQEVARAMEIAASHESKPEDNVPGRTLHSEGDKLIPLESSVEAKKVSVSEQQRELQELEERLRLAEEREREMKRKLGLLG